MQKITLVFLAAVSAILVIHLAQASPAGVDVKAENPVHEKALCCCCCGYCLYCSLDAGVSSIQLEKDQSPAASNATMTDGEEKARCCCCCGYCLNCGLNGAPQLTSKP